MRRSRHANIIATLGPSSNSKEAIGQLFDVGCDVFHLNFSHGTHTDHARVHQYIREVVNERDRPVCVLADLQGPKLRVGKFKNDSETLHMGQQFILDMTDVPGTSERVSLPHPEIFASMKIGARLLINDGKIG